jgi:molecular chaperone GrpE
MTTDDLTQNIPEAQSTPDTELELLRLREENKNLKEQSLYIMAEAENIRKRTERDKQDALRYAVSGLARDLLAVADNLSRALTNAPTDIATGFVAGIQITASELEKVFLKHGIVKVGKIGDNFDHNHHQAVAQIPGTDGQTPGTIAQVMQDGYILHDRLLRPAMVAIVASGVDTAV